MSYPDPEAAALGDVPISAAHVLETVLAPWGTAAVVLVEFVDDGRIASVPCIETESGWDAVGENDHPPALMYAGGWRVCSLWPDERLPRDVRSVTVAVGEELISVPVNDGIFLVAAWKRDDDQPLRTDPPEPRVLDEHR